MKLSTLCGFGAVTLLAACGGGGGGGGGGGDNIPSYPSAAAVIAEAERSLDAISPLGLTAPANFQRSGSASFSGPIVINDGTSGTSNASVLGGMTVSIDFANANNVTGQAGNFYDLADSPVGGTLALNNVEFSEGTGGGGFVADLTGELTNVGRAGSNDTYDYDLDVAALYYGSGVQALLSIMDGTATQSGTSTSRDLGGSATLERN